MLRQFSLLILLTFTGFGGFSSTAFSEKAADLVTGHMQNFAVLDEPRPLKDFQFVDNTGNTHTLGQYQGKVLLLNFWATWCAPCREEMPSLDRLQAELGSDQFEVLAIGQDLQGIEKVEKFLTALKIEHLKPLNDKTVKSGRAAGVFGLPASILVDRQGNEIGRLVGPAEWDSEDAKALLRHYIGDSPSS
ncbi:TlpA family protein disulfide reductase [Sneathiella chinensis]|uniref:Thioredoxin domain-containing protein n=1 Tax=Sneathiella chinensis TaxID=349750 RepID=A0ABQ5U1Z7_9PROT|nr:TlpA disulfide reductase family protein [Sneathiella chinensis]GLQ05283.1 hypothetical protein GCM10007924_05040 [Sneathiella chinensis]